MGNRIIIVVLAVLLICNSMVFAETKKSTDEEIDFRGFRFGSTYQSMLPTIKAMGVFSDYKRFRPIYTPLRIDEYSQDYKAFVDKGMPYKQSKENLSFIISQSSGSMTVAGHEAEFFWICFSGISLDSGKYINNQSSYEMYAGGYGFQFRKPNANFKSMNETAKPCHEGYDAYKDLKNKLSVLYGTPMEFYGYQKIREGLAQYQSCYSIWTGNNDTGILLSFMPKEVVSEVSLEYGKTNIYDILESLEYIESYNSKFGGL